MSSEPHDNIVGQQPCGCPFTLPVHQRFNCPKYYPEVLPESAIEQTIPAADNTSDLNRTVTRLRNGLIQVSYLLQRFADALDQDLMLDPGHSLEHSILETREWINALIQETASQDKEVDDVLRS